MAGDKLGLRVEKERRDTKKSDPQITPILADSNNIF
jgi:hypothetical protein